MFFTKTSKSTAKIAFETQLQLPSQFVKFSTTKTGLNHECEDRSEIMHTMYLLSYFVRIKKIYLWRFRGSNMVCFARSGPSSETRRLMITLCV